MSESASNRQRKFVRLKGFDYSKNGAYFITICSKNKTSVFGRIHAGQMELNRYGKIALCAWHDLINSFPFIELDEFVVMPNHVHGIVIIQSVTDCNSIHDKCSPLSRMVGTFKSSVTRQINALRLTPGCGLWQRNYYEHIIRNELSLDRIREYIALNPIHWGKDPDNPDR
jgi:REP element-mobilizing transposase RayT